VRLEGLGQLKNPLTSSRIEPATFLTANRIVLYIKAENSHYINDDRDLISQFIRISFRGDPLR
jgi:hypothetical protein